MFKRSSRVLLVTLLLFVLAGATYAFAATNTFPETAGYAGDGSATISGYAVTNIQYTTSGENLTGVSFDLNASASNVQASVVAGGTLVLCSDSGTGKSWSCTFTGVTVLDAVSLRVVAVQ
jgi:hypothetical protein